MSDLEGFLEFLLALVGAFATFAGAFRFFKSKTQSNSKALGWSFLSLVVLVGVGWWIYSSMKAASVEPPVEFVSAAQQVRSIQDDLERIAVSEQPQTRYLSLAGLYNAEGEASESLAQARSVLEDLWGLGPAVDERRTLYRVHLVRDGWRDELLWESLLDVDSTTLSLTGHRVPEVAEGAEAIAGLMKDDPAVLNAEQIISLLADPSSNLVPDSSKWSLKDDDSAKAVRSHFAEPVTLVRAAGELMIEDPAELKVIINASPRLLELGLQPLTRGETIPSAVWTGVDPENTELRGRSLYQRTAAELKRGDPI